ncbi:hypothetical protein DP49_5313 [Burkholderia pseudomallei]|nr:hypothetical protein DO73_4635 [Burkholderia pseudomallei]KGD58139.1 hypothetical protein DP49_5313 [Burkholderia pseudomallei]
MNLVPILIKAVIQNKSPITIFHPLIDTLPRLLITPENIVLMTPLRFYN